MPISSGDERFHQPHREGQWHEHEGSSPATNCKKGGRQDHIHLPSMWAMGCKPVARPTGPVDWVFQDVRGDRAARRERYRRKEGGSVVQGSKRKRQAGTEEDTTIRSSASLDALPTELLVQIIEPLIPTARTFHFSPAGLGRTMKGISVYQLCALMGDPSIGILASLALSCHRLRDVAYPIFYGGNHFVVELASVPITTQISGKGRILKGPSKTPTPFFGSWSRFVLRSDPIVSPILSANILPHVKTLVLGVNLSPEAEEDPWFKVVRKTERECQGDRQRLKSQIDNLVSILESYRCQLQTLHVKLSMAWSYRRDDGDIYSDSAFELCDDKSMSAGVNIEMTPTLAERPRIKAPAAGAHYDAILEPLQRLRGIGDARVIGLVTESFAKELEEDMLLPKLAKDESDFEERVAKRKCGD